MSSSETAGTTSQFCSREGCSNFRADDGPYCFTHRTREGGSSVGGEWQAGGEGALIGMLWTLGFVLVVVGFGVAESDNVLLGILIAGIGQMMVLVGVIAIGVRIGVVAARSR